MAAKNALQLTLAITDMSLFVADMVISEALAKKLSPEFLESWNRFNLIYGGTRLAYALHEIARGLGQLSRKALVETKDLTVAERNQLKKVISKVNEAAGIHQMRDVIAW